MLKSSIGSHRTQLIKDKILLDPAQSDTDPIQRDGRHGMIVHLLQISHLRCFRRITHILNQSDQLHLNQDEEPSTQSHHQHTCPGWHEIDPHPEALTRSSRLGAACWCSDRMTEEAAKEAVDAGQKKAEGEREPNPEEHVHHGQEFGHGQRLEVALEVGLQLAWMHEMNMDP